MSWKKLSITDKEIRIFTKQFKKKARFIVDESLGPEVNNYLKNLGWNSKYIAEFGLTGHSDEDIMALAFREDRILLTHDADFLDDRKFPPNRNPGVVILPGANGNEKALIYSIMWMLLIVGQFRNLYRNSKVVFSNKNKVTIIHQDRTGKMIKSTYMFDKNNSYEWIEDEKQDKKIL